MSKLVDIPDKIVVYSCLETIPLHQGTKLLDRGFVVSKDNNANFNKAKKFFGNKKLKKHIINNVPKTISVLGSVSYNKIYIDYQGFAIEVDTISIISSIMQTSTSSGIINSNFLFASNGKCFLVRENSKEHIEILNNLKIKSLPQLNSNFEPGTVYYSKNLKKYLFLGKVKTKTIKNKYSLFENYDATLLNVDSKQNWYYLFLDIEDSFNYYNLIKYRFVKNKTYFESGFKFKLEPNNIERISKHFQDDFFDIFRQRITDEMSELEFRLYMISLFNLTHMVSFDNKDKINDYMNDILSNQHLL